MYQLGLVSISFRKETPETLVEAVKAAGLTCIEWGSDVHAPWDDEEKLQNIVRLQKESGISCSSYGTYFRIGKNDVSEFPGYIRAAKLLGTDILRLWCGTKGSKDYTQEELEKLYADCRLLAAMAEEAGVKLCMECHNGTVTDWKESALALMQAVDSPAFRMYWQPNQLRSVEENLAYAALIAPWTEHLHVFNWDCPNGGPVEKYPLAQAVDTWESYIEQFPRDRVFLLEFMPDGEISSVYNEADALKKIVNCGGLK